MMTPHTFFIVFAICYACQFLCEALLVYVNRRHTSVQKEPPEFLADQISPAVFSKAHSYTLDRLRLEWMGLVIATVFFWLLLADKGLVILDLYAQGFVQQGTLSHSVLTTVFVMLYFFITSLPLKIYSQFVIEEKYGFNRMRLVDFFIDVVRGGILAALLGVPILYLVYYLMQVSGASWWLWAWGAVTLVQLILVAVYPVFLAPLFNKFTPLADGALKNRIEELAKKIGFKQAGIFVMDGSRRSGHSNAYFAGMGSFRKIVLFDTLINQLTDDELLAVLAHEMGHNVKKHIFWGSVVSAVFMLAGFYVLSLLRTAPFFYEAFGVAESAHAALILFVMISGPFMLPIEPLMNLWMRRNEYEADRFAVLSTGAPEPMQSALVKLARENLSNLDPHPAYSFFHYTHPTLSERIKEIKKVTC